MQGRTAEGLKDLERALTLYPRYGQAQVWKGRALLTAGRLAPAQRAFKAALACDPMNVWARLGWAACLEKAGKQAQARAEFQRARRPALFQS